MKRTFLLFLSAAGLLACASRAHTQAAAADLSSLSATIETPVMAEAPAESEAEAVQVGEVVEFDHTVHDFGDICVSDGPQTCSFTVRNVSDKTIAVFEVVSSCGCTDVQWTRSPLKPGESGTITATYKNEDGAFPFDKTLTVYVSGLQRPVILRLRGNVHQKKPALSELYGENKLGALGLKSRTVQAGTLRQGESVSSSVHVANLSGKALRLSFTDVPGPLTLSVRPNPIPPRSTAVLDVSVRSDEQLYGWNEYRFTPVLDGRPAEEGITVRAYTRAAFSEAEQKTPSLPRFESSTFHFGTRTRGEKIVAEFVSENAGTGPLHIYKVDADKEGIRPEPFRDLPAGQKGTLRLSLDTTDLPEGETVIMLTLTTNSPKRPLVNLFLTGMLR